MEEEEEGKKMAHTHLHTKRVACHVIVTWLLIFHLYICNVTYTRTALYLYMCVAFFWSVSPSLQLRKLGLNLVAGLVDLLHLPALVL